MTKRGSLCVALFGFTFSGCGPGAEEVVLSPAREVVLAEPDTLPLGMPGYLAVSEDGELYLSDAMNHRVLGYDRRGVPMTRG